MNKRKHIYLDKQFTDNCQGEDWEMVVDLNTQTLVECAKKKIPLFSKPLESLSIPILFIGSKQDDMCRKDMLEEYAEMKKKNWLSMVAYILLILVDTQLLSQMQKNSQILF